MALRVLLSALLQKLLLLMKRNITFRNILNKSGPNVEPRYTPVVIFVAEINYLSKIYLTYLFI